MRYVIIILLAVSFLDAAKEVNISPSSGLKRTIKGMPQPMSTILSDQPDTLAYDDWDPSWGYNCSDCLGAVRFTAVLTFELKAIYFDLYNTNGSTDPFCITVYDTLDGNVLAGPYCDTYDPGFWRVQIDIDPIEIPCGHDFYIVVGPQGGWGYNTMVFDQGTTVFRSYIKFSGEDWAVVENGDLCVRAGGELSCACDLISECIFNSLHKFFIRPGNETTFSAVIKNYGSETIPPDSYSVHFVVSDTFGTTYFSEIVPGSDTLFPWDEVTLSTTTSWNPTSPGYYLAIDTILKQYDPPLDNVSTMELRVYDESHGNWFYYTDYSPEACYCWIPGNGWATGFLLDCYPTTLDSIAIGFDVSPGPFAIDVPIEIWWGMESPETLLVSGTIDTVFGGIWYSVVPPIEIDSGMIFIAYHYYVDPNGNSVCLNQDESPPIAGRNHCMDTTTFVYYGNPPQWFEDDEGDWFMWAHFSPCLFQPVCGDVNCNGEVGLDDIIYLAHYLFSGGPPPCSYWASDVNCSGNVGMDDLTYLANYLFAGGPPPDCCPSRVTTKRS